MVSNKHNTSSTVRIRVHGMRVASAFLLAGILAIAASSPHASFRYELLTSFRRNGDSCRVCYADDCITMDEARCEYYVEADEILEKPVEDGAVTDIDEMMYDLTEEATMSWAMEGCIPFVSQHSDCNKENFCVGCQTCECTSAGKWACNEVQQCRAEVELDVNHSTLVMVIEKLMEYDKSRRKRSITHIPNAMTPQEKQMSLVNIAKWMYGVTPTTYTDRAGADNFTTVLENSTQNTNSSQHMELENLDFEEVLNNIANEDQTYKIAKSKLKDNYYTDYMGLDDYKIKRRLESYNAGDHFMNVLNAIEEGNDVTEPISTDGATLVVDLLPHVNNNYSYDHNNATDTNEDDVNNIIYKEENNTINILKDSFELDAINIMKRDVMPVTNVENMTQSINATNPFETTTDKNNLLKNGVLVPLTNIIDNKANEVKNLLQIKENLIKYISMFNDTVLNVTSDSEAVNSGSNTAYELDIFPEIQEDLRKTNPQVLDKLLYKLKRDIYEVFRDISTIQKVSKTRDIPNDLKKLIRSMKYFLHEQNSINNSKREVIQFKDIRNSRRVVMKPANADTQSSIKSQLIDIFEALDKNTPQSNALIPLSRSLKRIIKRIIKQNYVDEFSMVGLKVFDTNYNLSDDLRTIGKSWPQLTANVANSSPYEKLYAMKLLHFALSEDIGKIKDAIALVDFAHSRRMSPNIETQSAERVMDRINSGLSSIKNKVEVLIKHHAARTKMTKHDALDKKKKKQSFLNRIRNMLRSSKKDILDMAKKNIPKSDIFKIIAKKKLKELNLEKDEDTMLRWQNNLNIAKKINKRDIESRLNSMKNRIKNIIPKYLRGKLDPAIAKKWITKQQTTMNKKPKSTKQKNPATPTTKATILPLMKIHKSNITANPH